MICFFLFVSSNIEAQSPIEGSLMISGNELPYLEDYISQNPQLLFLNLIFADGQFGERYDVVLKLSINGSGLSIQTKRDLMPLMRPIGLEYNGPVALSGIDLSEYFNPDNLDFFGISKEEFLKNSRLPEGLYTICFEAFDVNNQLLPVSNSICAFRSLQEFDPPRIIRLIGEENYVVPQHYMFQWQPMHFGLAGSEYQLEIYEKIEGLTADQIFDFSSPVSSIRTTQTSYLYAPVDPLLKEETPYLVRVKVETIGPNKAAFKNNGYSKHEEFVLRTNCQMEGISCDDGDMCTIKDEYNSSCVCEGIYSDSDLDGVCDAEDLCEGYDDNIDENLDGIPDGCETDDDCKEGDLCEDGDPCTVNDTYDADCNCVSGLDICKTCTEGEACDDEDDCTTGTYYDADCNCVGGLGGDSDGDGICDDEDNCPNLDNLLFDQSCDDGDPCTINDYYDQLNCECIGYPVVDGEACDDGSDCTFNDVFQIDGDNCTCVGEMIDDDEDGICNEDDQCQGFNDALIGTTCDDGMTCTINDIYVANEGVCSCIGTPIEEGDFCDDGDICTQNDEIVIVDAECICQGTYSDYDGDGICDGEDDCPDNPDDSCENDIVCGDLLPKALPGCSDEAYEEIVNISTTPISEQLMVGSLIHVADFLVEISELNGSSGKGFVKLFDESGAPIINDIQMNVVFTNLQVNEYCEMYAGEM